MPQNAFVVVALALITAASCAPAVHPPPAAPASALPARPVEVPLLPYFRELRTVRLTSGPDTLTFLLDTGGGHTLLTVEAADALGCVPFGRSSGHRMSGERVEFRRCTGVPLELGGVPLDHPEIAVFDLMALLPPVLPRLDGVLSLSSFEDRVVTIDLAGARLVLESDASAAERREAMQPLVARRATGENGSTLAVFLAARAVGAPVWLLLDNGNLVGTLLSPHAARQAGLEPPGAGEDGEPPVLEAPAFQVLGLDPAPERIVVRELIHDGVLGASFMERGVFTFDFRGKEPWVGFAEAAGEASDRE